MLVIIINLLKPKTRAVDQNMTRHVYRGKIKVMIKRMFSFSNIWRKKFRVTFSSPLLQISSLSRRSSVRISEPGGATWHNQRIIKQSFFRFENIPFFMLHLVMQGEKHSICGVVILSQTIPSCNGQLISYCYGLFIFQASFKLFLHKTLELIFTYLCISTFISHTFIFYCFQEIPSRWCHLLQPRNSKAVSLAN